LKTSSFYNLIPGFSIIKNKIITPLLVATERVVDYIIKEDDQEKMMSLDGSSQTEFKSLPETFSSLSLVDLEKRQTKKRRY